jgi:predicted alpha/beta-hydrolase family hydrolase
MISSSVVVGSFVTFCSSAANELRATIKKSRLPATLQVIEGGDHSLKVPKSSGLPQQQLYESTMDEIAGWLRLKLS